MSQQAPDPRQVAVQLMTGVTADRTPFFMLDSVLAALAPEDRARATRLATGALRWSPRADRALGPFLKAKPEEMVLNVLRLALFEMGEEGTPPHAAVHAAVNMVEGRTRGFVNAVLRTIQRKGTPWADLPLPVMPKWLRKRIVAAWGKEAATAIEVAQAAVPGVDLTFKAPDPALTEALGGVVLPTGSLRLPQGRQVSALQGFNDGAWWVQDAAAALPVQVLQPKAGERVLDVCAAPGGKTLQMASAGADVTALDISETRLRRLHQNLTRTGLSASVIVADALEWTPDVLFDAILVDAPCTATGTLRRHPDLAFAKDGTELETLLPLQTALLDRALGWLKPGGRLVYCVCSLLPDEGEAQLAAALKRTPGLQVLDVVPTGVPDSWRAPAGGLRTRPDYWSEHGGLDGFFIAGLRKPA
jgi:16S rRNA (cytosine967-C5)-methyltransferase